MAIRGDEYQVFTARDLGAALKHFRTMSGVTQADAAEAVGVGQPAPPTATQVSVFDDDGQNCLPGGWRPESLK